MLRRSFCALGKSLVVAETAGASIAAGTLSAVTAAAACGPVTALVTGADVKAAAAAAAKIQGVASVIAVEHEALGHGMPEATAAVVSAVAQKGAFTHVVAGSSAFGKGVVPRAAAKADCMPIADVSAIVSEDTFVRGAFAGNVVTTVQSKDAVKFFTIRASNFERAAADGGSGAVESGEAPAAPGTSAWKEDIVDASDKPDLQTAAAVVSGGRGLKNKDNWKLLFDLAAPLKAAVGATRAVVESGEASNDMQIGQTGKIVAPQLYVAVGLSGAIQHVAGMKDSKTIVAINNDAEAPIFQVADYGLVDDLFKAVPALTDALKK